MNGKLKSPKSESEKKTKSELFTIIFVKPWPYWVGGIGLALINILYFIITGNYWSITIGITRWGVWLMEKLGLETAHWSVWEHSGYIHPLYERATWSNLGIIFGAFIAVLLAKQFKIKQIKNKKSFLLALAGGWLMGYGARVASGCNIGGLYSAISSLALNGWLFLPGIFLGVWLGSKVLYRWFLY